MKSGDTYPPLRIVTNIAEFEPKFPDWEHDVALACVPERAHESSLTYEEAVDKVYEYVQQDDAEGYESSDDEYAEEQAEECGDVIGSKKWCEAMHLPSAVEWKHKRMRVVCHPEPHDYISWKAKVDECSKRTKLEQDWRSAGLQVIVKLSSIELTPEKSQYKGGSWHLEGMMNEHIVATAIYYYDCKNVTESRLAYRMHAELDELDLQYEQDDHQPLCDLFGTDSMRDEPALQELGSIATPEGRLLVFPNTLQHQVQPFQLVDKQKPGHRRFLVLWLVDPHYRITSTANVPPQQHDWWADETLMKVVDNSKLPAEISKMIMDGKYRGAKLFRFSFIYMSYIADTIHQRQRTTRCHSRKLRDCDWSSCQNGLALVRQYRRLWRRTIFASIDNVRESYQMIAHGSTLQADSCMSAR